MAYDVVGESLRLIGSRELTPVTRLSRRRRHAAMAVDVVDDMAVTVFARRSVGGNVEETHVFVRRAGGWVPLGGGGGPLDDDALEHRPAQLPPGWPGETTGVDPRVLALDGSGGVLDSGATWFGSIRGRWINHAIVRVNADVTRLVVGDRQIEVPWHGRCVVLWPGRRRSQDVVAVAGDGGRLGRVTLPSS